jgi:hypothetical protein
MTLSVLSLDSVDGNMVTEYAAACGIQTGDLFGENLRNFHAVHNKCPEPGSNRESCVEKPKTDRLNDGIAKIGSNG